jgi:tetratricopeptide (TPR) repeat protein
LFEEACKLNPTDVEALLALGNILFDMDDYEGADKIVQQALASAPAFRPVLLLQAKLAYEQHQYTTAISTLNKLILSSDTTVLFARMLCVSYFNLRDYSNVMNCVNFLIRNHFDSEWLYYYMGVAVRELGNVKGSVDWFKLAIDRSISDNMKTYYSQLAKSYESIGDYANAIRAYKAAYNYSMEGIYLYHLARNYDIFYKDKSTALLYYEKYLQSEDTVRLAREYARLRMQDMGKF